MAKVLVTGATGFVGSALVRALLKRGEKVHVLVRQRGPEYPNLEGLSVKAHHGDVQYPESLKEAVCGMEVVYHAAAVYQFFPWWRRKVPSIDKINVEGTRNVLEAARQAEVKRVVYTSSIITIGKSKGEAHSNEDTPYQDGQFKSHYARTKCEAEKLVLGEAKNGLPAVVVNPGVVIGERDSKPTPSGEVILKFLKRIYPGYFDALWCTADVDDAAQGHIAAAEKGKTGERYILCNKEHYTLRELFKILEKISGVRSPFIKIPYPALLAFVFIDEWSGQFIRHRPLLSSKGLNFCRTLLRCDNSKAVRELGYRETPIEKTLEKAVKWYRDHGYVKH